MDILMSSDIMAAQMSTKGITFSRAQTGWIFREDKRVTMFMIHRFIKQAGSSGSTESIIKLHVT